MKEHRTKTLRVITPDSIQSDSFDIKHQAHCCCDCEDADGELFDMLQLDWVSSRNCRMPSDNFYFCCCHHHQQQQQQHQQQQQRQLQQLQLQRHHTNNNDAECTGSMQSLTATATSTALQTTTQCRIVATDNIATFTAGTAAVDFTKNDDEYGFYRWFSCEFQSVSTRWRKKESKNERERDTEALMKLELADGDADAGYGYQQHSIHFANTEQKTWTKSQTPEICHCRFTSWCSRKLRKHEKLLSLSLTASLSSSSSSSSATFTSTDSDRFSSIFDLISGVDANDDHWLLRMKRIKEAIGREKSTYVSVNGCCGRRSQLWCNLKDADGNTALLVSGRKLLKEGSYDKAVELATLLLAEGSDANASNNENRTLLSYSVQYMDESIRLTTLLINYGADVWPAMVDSGGGSGTELPLRENRFNGCCGLAATEIEKYVDPDGLLDVDNEIDIGDEDCNSAFACFLISIIKSLKLSEHCFRTLYLLAEVMGERPEMMRLHVMSTMFRHAKCYSILGPVFLQIKVAISPYWTQPQTLKYLCKSAIRKSIFGVAGRFATAENVSSLMLPPSLQSYVLLEN